MAQFDISHNDGSDGAWVRFSEDGSFAILGVSENGQSAQIVLSRDELTAMRGAIDNLLNTHDMERGNG